MARNLGRQKSGSPGDGGTGRREVRGWEVVLFLSAAGLLLFITYILDLPLVAALIVVLVLLYATLLASRGEPEMLDKWLKRFWSWLSTWFSGPGNGSAGPGGV